MQKLVTIAALILVCFAASSAAYYYARYLPRLHDAELAEQRRKTDLEKRYAVQQGCHEILFLLSQGHVIRTAW
jgi:hypothetical protein